MSSADNQQISSARNDWLCIAGVLSAGCGVLAVATFLPTLWARQADELADIALSFVSIATATLATLFLPLWAARWPIVTTGVLAVAVLTMLAGSVEGAPIARSAWVTIRLAALLLGFATIWISLANWQQARRFAWLALAFWSLGVPTATYLQADFASDQGGASTIHHLSIASFLK